MLGSILVFVVVLSVLILVHEFGHYYVARRAGIWVEEFGIGLPPRLFGKKIGDTIYSVNALPFGGFVRLHGENTKEGVTKPKRAFINKSKKARSSVVVAGVIMNFILAILAFSLVYTFSGIPRQSNNVRVAGVSENSPAQVSGLSISDVVREVDGNTVKSTDDFIREIEAKLDDDVVLTVENGEDTRKITVKPRSNPPEGEGPLGVTITATENYFPPLWKRPFIGIYYGFKEALFWGGAVIMGFIKIFRDLFSGTAPDDIAGPVGIFAITSQAASFGILAVVNLFGILSVNLAILNVVPFPALDGGRLFFIAVEALLGKRVVPKIEATIHAIGMAILILALLAITAHDIRRISQAGGLSQFIDSTFK